MLGVITNGSVRKQNVKIDTLGIRQYMDAIVISEQVGIEKPDKRIFHTAVSSISVKPPEAWFVGDHPINDVLGADEAGLTGIWMEVGYSWPEDHDGPKWKIHRMNELLSLLELA